LLGFKKFESKSKFKYMKYKINYFKVLPLLLIVIMAGCGKKDQTQQKAPPEIPVVKVERQDVPIYQEFVGQIYGLKDITIRARVEGFLEGIHFEEGTRVNKGQLLYTIDPQPFKAKVAAQMSNLAEAKTMLAKSESDLNRIRPLAENNAVSQSDLDAAVAQFEAAQASVEAAKANLEYAQIELSYTQIKSPINGIIGKTQAKVGDFVGRDPQSSYLNEVSNIEEILVEFFLSESQYLRVVRELVERKGKIEKRDTGDRAELRLILADGNQYDQVGYLTFMDRGVNPSTGSILLQASFPNPDRILRPGQFARVVVEMDKVDNAMLIPQQVVNEVQGIFSVYVVDDSSKVENRSIGIFEQYKDYYIVESGLKGDETIVLEGLQKVRSGMEIRPVETIYKSKQTNNK
jgi:membrane fusion protein (multidrug efflux system)